MKDWSSYAEINGTVQKLSPITHTLKMRGGTIIAIDESVNDRQSTF